MNSTILDSGHASARGAARAGTLRAGIAGRLTVKRRLAGAD